ncbi:60S ribosomal protein l44 [Phtheirospermum japonicum]|uniref:60S ribosomal protein l44 n=1 Tax=Phtheirospermum japonicum TaxID=374723 RepID=A0A830BSA6_9LAMI|nr:60S ribosomal protein l44 [Phtheirospermum japonicum]
MFPSMTSRGASILRLVKIRRVKELPFSECSDPEIENFCFMFGFYFDIIKLIVLSTNY